MPYTLPDMLKQAFFCISLLLPSLLSAQVNKINGIKLPVDYADKCQECADIFAKKPTEVHFDVIRDKKDGLFFRTDNEEWFNKIIAKSGDGLSIDIVDRQRYACGSAIDANSPLRGEVLEPIYAKDLKESIYRDKRGLLFIKIGEVPEELRKKDLEFNLMFIKNKYLCMYYPVIRISAARWDLLDMGMYMDSLTYKEKVVDTVKKVEMKAVESFVIEQKHLRFELFFEKNKAVYSAADIKPVFDSLDITDFTITKISIRSYASVEGNLQRNLDLLNERGQSIAAAFQANQKSAIQTEVTSAENWVEFLADIAESPYADWTSLPQEEIKNRLKDKKTAAALEPYLKKHRKAVIILDMERKNTYSQLKPTVLVNMFNKSIEDKNIKKASELQASIFSKIRDKEVNVAALNDLEIPKQAEFGGLLTKNAVFEYMMDERACYRVYKELLELQDLMPQDGHVRYNAAVLKFRLWLAGDEKLDPEQFKNEINNLSKYLVPANLIKRMMVNFNIVMCDYYMQQKDYVNKDKALKFISSNYSAVPMKELDYLSLGQYFTSYAKYDWATKLLSPRVKKADSEEELVFYYLNLTLSDDKLVKKPDYKSVITNAIKLNTPRFCELFAPSSKGGMSFQLLENEYLRKSYCEVCH